MPLFGPDHIFALAATAGLAAWFVRWGRDGDRPAVARGLAAVVLLSMASDPVLSHLDGRLSLATTLPLELCDAAAVATMVALWTRRPSAFELAYFWGLSGTLQALFTPTVAAGFPHPEFFRYFVLHGGIVVAVLYLGPGTGLQPRPGAAARVFAWTAVYAVGVGLADWALGANYMFLCSKPAGSVLELFGPWPWYLIGAAWVGAGLFWLLDLPYRARRAAAGTGSAAPRDGAAREPS